MFNNSLKKKIYTQDMDILEQPANFLVLILFSPFKSMLINFRKPWFLYLDKHLQEIINVYKIVILFILYIHSFDYLLRLAM